MRYCILLACCAYAALHPATAYAAGFYLQEQSVSALGSAYAGSAAQARDASILFYNPAAMTALKTRQMTAGGSLIMAKANMNDTGSTVNGAAAGGPDSDDPTDPVLVPHFYAITPIGDGTVWTGIGVSAPFGLSTEYDEDWYGRYDSTRSDLQTINIQPSIAVRVNDRFSVGGGIDIQTARAELEAAVTDTLSEGQSRLKGDDVGYGWNAGLLWQPQDETRIGLHYRSSVHHNLKGRIDITGTTLLDESGAGSAKLQTPNIASLGIAQDIDDRWTVLGQVTWFGWNDFQTIRVIRADGTEAEDVTQNYQTTRNYSLGAEYRWNADLTLRAGYQFDESPTTNEFRSTRIPDNDRHWFTAGAGYVVNDALTIDGGAAWIAVDDADINVSRNSGLADISVRRDDSSIGILSLGVSYKF